jgi:hypothetical protein
MIELLSRLFSRQETPADRLLHAAVDIVIDGTDSRLRVAPNVGRHLRQPVRTAIAYVRGLADHLGPAVDLSAETFGSDPRVHALFASVDAMRQTIGRDPALHDLGHAAGDEAFALLLAERQIKHVLGMELHGDLVMRDLKRSLLVFANHRLRAVATSEAESQRAVRLLAFRQLVAAAHECLEGVKAGQPIDPAAGSAADENGRRVADIVARVRRSGASGLTLEDYLVFVVEVLAHPERHLRAEPFTAVVDRMGALAEGAKTPADAERVMFWEMWRQGSEAPTAALMVRLRRADFPPPRLVPELI